MTAPRTASVPIVAPDPSLEWLIIRANLSDDAKEAIAGSATCDASLDTLLTANLDVDAVRMIAFALPPREGVWWAWTAATHASRLPAAKAVTPELQGALAATEQWIANPDGEHRRAAWKAAQHAGLETSAGSAAAAAYFTGGSVAPADIAPIPPPPAIHAALAFVSVVAASATDPAQFAPMARGFVAQGLAVVKQLGGYQTCISHARTHHDAMLEQHKAVTEPQPAAAAPAG